MLKIKKKYVSAAGSFDIESRRARQKARREKKAAKRQEILDVLNSGDDSDDILEYLFQELVPSSGPAKSLGGEYVRAIMKILYRDYNDGDRFYDGYGIETCGNAAQLLFNDIPGVDYLMYDLAESPALTDDEYTNGIKEIANKVIEFIKSHPEVLDEPGVDMYTIEPDDIKDMQPEYEYEPDISGDLYEYVEDDRIDWDDVREFLENLCYAYGGDIYQRAADWFTITGLTKEEYEAWDDSFYNELMSYLDELESQFPDVTSDGGFLDSI